MVGHDKDLVGLWLWRRDASAQDRSEIAILLARKLRAAGLFAEARQVLEDALRQMPNTPKLQRSLGLERFRDGDIVGGLALYDKGRWRLESFDKYRRPFPAPMWQGEPLAGKRLLVWAEQGIGDQAMQARVLGGLVGQGARITLESDIRLHPLLKLRERIDCVQQFDTPAPELSQRDFDFQTSMLSAWRYVENPLSGAVALQADAGLARRYRSAWSGMGDKRNVGLSWFSKAAASGAERSIDPALLRPLTKMGAVRLHSLQYGKTDLKAISQAIGAPVLHDSQCDPLAELTRQAAQIAALDLVITIDNATAHLAGALGTPCWMLLPKASEWRWGTPERPLPLYPSVRLFQAGDTGDWSAALWAMFTAFEDWLGKAR